MYERILVAIDDGAASREAVRHARALAGSADAVVYVLHVVRVDNPLSFGIEEVADLNAAEERLAGIVSELFDGDATVHSVLRRGVPSERIVEFADEIDADLIVIGRHGGGDLRDYLLGSTPARVLATTSRPTLLVSDTPE